jgi:hypothetical protein
MGIPFGLCNAPATFQRLINRIIRHLLRIELVINTIIHIDEGEGTVVVAYIYDILIAPKGSLERHYKQVLRVFQLLMENNEYIESNKCGFKATEITVLGFVGSRSGIRMDPDKANASVDSPRPKTWKEVEQLSGL